jgi:hypothetical protein
VEPSFVYVAWKHDIVVEKSKSKSPMWSDNFKNWSYVFCRPEEYMEHFLFLIDSKNGFRFKEELGAKP